MAIVLNKASAIGDTIVIKTSVPLLGIVALQSFVDTTVGETGTRYFNKQFRYSTDGITYSAWITLTTANIASIVVSPTSTFFIEYNYTRAGTDTTGDLEFTDNTLVGTFTAVLNGPIYLNSIFAPFFNSYDVEVLTWCLNVCEKLYKPGIIPTYMTRNENGNKNGEDVDYIAFWCTVCCYFSLIVNFARVFENFTTYTSVLKEYLNQKGLFFCNADTTTVDLTYLMDNFYNEISKRGTKGIVDKKSEGAPIDGELNRLLCFDSEECGDVIFSLTENWKFGWNIDNCSPLYRGNMAADMCVRGYENNPLVLDITKYPTATSGQITKSTATPNTYSQEIFNFQTSPAYTDTGIKHTIDGQPTIKVDARLCYEFTFDYRVNDATSLNLNFTCKGFDKYGNQINLPPVAIASANIFYSGNFKGVVGEWYTFRGIIYGINTIMVSRDVKPINGTTHLRMTNANICSLSPEVYISTGLIATPSDIDVTNVRLRPLDTPYSTGFIQTNNFINVWGDNQNAKYSKAEVEQIERRFLIPYNSHIKNIWIDELDIPPPAAPPIFTPIPTS